MSAYFVIYQNITNAARFIEYVNVAMPVIDRRGGRLVAQGIPEAISPIISA